MKTGVASVARKWKTGWNPTHPLLFDGGPTYDELLHFFNRSSGLLCIAGFDGRFKRLNPAWVAALGWTREQLMAGVFLDFVHPDDHSATLRAMRSLKTGNTTIGFENRYRCKDGDWKWMQWSACPQLDRRLIYATARDVSQQRNLEKTILEAQDRERERVGCELHDGLCQEMAGIAAMSNTLARKLAATAAAESAIAHGITKLLRQTIRHARDLARGYIPLQRKEVNLIPALAGFCATTETLFRVRCQFQCKHTSPHLNAAQKSHLYRIAQEAVNNAIVHGRAKRIEVTLTFLSGRGTLTISNNGHSLRDPIDESPGVGLQTMAYRARLIGASFAMKRRRPRGAIVTCSFPVTGTPPNP